MKFLIVVIILSIVGFFVSEIERGFIYGMYNMGNVIHDGVGVDTQHMVELCNNVVFQLAVHVLKGEAWLSSVDVLRAFVSYACDNDTCDVLFYMFVWFLKQHPWAMCAVLAVIFYTMSADVHVGPTGVEFSISSDGGGNNPWEELKKAWRRWWTETAVPTVKENKGKIIGVIVLITAVKLGGDYFGDWNYTTNQWLSQAHKDAESHKKALEQLQVRLHNVESELDTKTYKLNYLLEKKGTLPQSHIEVKVNRLRRECMDINRELYQIGQCAHKENCMNESSLTNQFRAVRSHYDDLSSGIKNAPRELRTQDMRTK